MFLNKTEDIAVFITGPATVTSAGADRRSKDGRVIVVEGTQSFGDGAGLAQRDVFADDIDDVVGFFDTVFQGCAVFCHGPSAGWGPADHCGPGSSTSMAMCLWV